MHKALRQTKYNPKWISQQRARRSNLAAKHLQTDTDKLYRKLVAKNG